MIASASTDWISFVKIYFTDGTFYKISMEDWPIWKDILYEDYNTYIGI
jgi:hypothetical protein